MSQANPAGDVIPGRSSESPRAPCALDAAQVESFVERGFCTLRGAFSRAQAEAACEVVWWRMAEKRGIRRDDPATWPEAYDIEEHLDTPEVLACFTPRLAEAIVQLVGPHRWAGRQTWGFWPVSFHYGRYDRGVPPYGWHVDGNWFRHRLDATQQGLLVLGLFTDVGEGGGGTVLAGGSHRRATRVLARHPDGLEHRALFEAVLAEPLGNFHTVTGQAGDVVLAHPLLFHTRGFKHAGAPRIVSNTEAGLVAPPVLDRAAPGLRTPLEESFLRALETDADPVASDAMMCTF